LGFVLIDRDEVGPFGDPLLVFGPQLRDPLGIGAADRDGRGVQRGIHQRHVGTFDRLAFVGHFDGGGDRVVLTTGAATEERNKA
jgi:hypothetical protein